VPGYYVWAVPGNPVAVHLRLDVVDRLAAEFLRGLGAVPKRGAEVGGVLLGSIEPGLVKDTSIVRIEDFEPVPCSYVRGPSYLLSEEDRKLFDEICQRRSPVGYYRSHTREGLLLGPEDLDFLDKDLPLASNVALLVKPLADKPAFQRSTAAINEGEKAGAASEVNIGVGDRKYNAVEQNRKVVCHCFHFRHLC